MNLQLQTPSTEQLLIWVEYPFSLRNEYFLSHSKKKKKKKREREREISIKEMELKVLSLLGKMFDPDPRIC